MSSAVAPAGLALAPPAQALTRGEVLVIDANAGAGSQGVLLVVDPATGARTLLSEFGIGANPGSDVPIVVVGSSRPAPDRLMCILRGC